MFARDGYVAARVIDIAAGAHIALGTFYIYFDNKDAVLAELLEEVFREMYESSRAPWLDEPAYEAIRGAVDGYLRSYRAHADMLRVMREALSVDAAFAAFWFSWRERFMNRIVRNVRRSQASGLTPALDPVLTASALGGMLDDFCWIWLSMGGDRTTVEDDRRPFDLASAVEVLAALWYRALFCTDELPGHANSLRPSRPRTRRGDR